MMARHNSMCVCAEREREVAKERRWCVKYVACSTLFHSVSNLTIKHIGVFV